MKRTITSFLIAFSLLVGAREFFDGGAMLTIPGTVSAQTAATPELPRTYLDTTYPTSTGATINVAAGGNLQTALNQAQPGDQIVLQGGAVFTGNFTLPAKSGNDWIIIRTANLSGLPAEGTRVSAANAAAMAKIITPNTIPAIKAAPASHHYRLVGLEIGIASGVTLNYGIAVLGDTGTAQNTLAQVPHDLVIDRCYIHGNATGDVSRGVALNSAATAIIDSTIANCHGVGFDTQAIGGWNGPGPFKIVNNYLEGAGENVLLGGADPSIASLVSSDIEFRRNYCAKPLSWCPTEPAYAGVHWSVKNLFELKNAQRVLVDGNVFENNWVDGQAGIAVQLTPRNQDGSAPWATVQDVTFTNNIVRHAAAGFNILGTDDIHSSQQAQRIQIKNDLFDDIGGTRWGTNGRLFQIVGGPANVQIDHVTAFQTGNVITADVAPSVGFSFTNNLVPHNDYGVIGSGYGVGRSSLNYYFPSCVFTHNVLVGGSSASYPTGNFFPVLMSAVGFVNLAGGNYQLAPVSLYCNAATDGTDIGVNFTTLQAAIDGQTANPQPPDPPLSGPPQVSIAAAPATGTAPLNVAFTSNATEPGGSIVAYNWNFGDGQTATGAAPAHVYQSAGNFNAQVTVTDANGVTATSSAAVSVSAPAPPPPTAANVVLYASQATVRVGNWQVVSDATAAGGARIWNPDAGAAKVVTPLANPPSYFEVSFSAQSGVAYHLWVRGKAQNDSPYNDSVHVQFSDSVNAGGAAVFRIGTTTSTEVNLEEDLNYGVKGWGWQDNGWGVGVMGSNIYFASTGTHRIRVQVREDGFSIDQIVLSPSAYLNASPGALKNDTKILASTATGLSLTAASPSSGSAAGGTTVSLSGSGFVAGARVRFGNVAATSITVTTSQSLTAVTPPQAAGHADVTVINPDGTSTTLAGGYSYMPMNHPPQVSPVASVTTGVAPLTVNFTANATDPDGDALTVRWDFGDGKTATGANVSHVYTSAGQFSAVVSVTDKAGATAGATVKITANAPPPPTVQVTSPNTGQSATVGSSVTINWTASGALSSQTIQLSLNGGTTWSNVASLSGSAKSYTWSVPNSPTQTARIRVSVYTASGQSSVAMNPGNFSIVAKSKGK